jgi:ABC-type nitrate/sulfonate/bicarbonate transport system substrate-binding protein
MNLDRPNPQTPTLCPLKGVPMSITERRIRPARKALTVATAIAIAITAAACSGRTSNSGTDSTGLAGARFTLMLQSTANANKVVEVHAVNALKAQGVNASIKWNASSPNIAITQLTTGTIDAYSEAVLGGVGAVASGIKMKDFALAQPRQDYVLLANSSINTIADLKGKKIGVQDTTGVNYAQALMVVQKAGLTPKDVDIIAVGGQSTRLPALVAGRVDATMLSHAAEQQLGPEGFKTIFDYTKDASNLYDDNIFASEEWLGKNSALAVAFNKAILDSFEWFNDPANKDAVVTEALAIDPAADKDATATVFENLRAANAYPNGTILDPALVDQQQQLYQEAGSLPATVPIAQWVDDSFAKQAKGQS